MTTPDDMQPDAPPSPFHAGERAVQERVGVRDAIDEYGRRGIRTFMPEQHRGFFRRLPFFVVGTVDERGRPWAGMIVAAPGFLGSPDPQTLHVAALPGECDPVRGGIRDGAAIGGLGIELNTRRRNRVNGRIALDAGGGGFTIHVEQSFGNCKQYINAREARLVDVATPPRQTVAARGPGLDDEARALVARADTAFVASCCDDGVDVSHRGGLPGFMRVVDDRTIVLPDYRGNFFFNTLGNLVANPRCGLLVMDFASGTTLQATGTGTIVWDVPDDDPAWRGAERLVRIEIDEAVRIDQAVALAWELIGYAPQFARFSGGLP